MSLDMIWHGTDLQTMEEIQVVGSPLRVVVGVIDAPLFVVEADKVKHMAIAVSAVLGTACVIHLEDPDGEGNIVIEAVPHHDMHTQRYKAALQTARNEVEREIDLERAWNDADADRRGRAAAAKYAIYRNITIR